MRNANGAPGLNMVMEISPYRVGPGTPWRLEVSADALGGLG